jgi:hypothetical protein
MLEIVAAGDDGQRDPLGTEHQPPVSGQTVQREADAQVLMAHPESQQQSRGEGK